ncbi:hypothetical protein MRX96_002909 [Rhipicephalus microplus]
MAADGLMDWALRHLHYRLPPFLSNQEATDLEFCPSLAPRSSLTDAAEHCGDGVVRFVCCCPTGAADLSLAAASSCTGPVVLPGPAVLLRHSASVVTLRAGTNAVAGSHERSNACAVPSLWWIRPNFS